MTTQRDTLLELDDKLRHKDFKLRPVFKTEEELIEERNQIFELPRKNCMQIMPELKRLSAKGSQHRLHVLKKIMKRARYDDVDQHLSHVTHVDVSDAIVPEGEVSKRLYEDIFVQRDFDLYGAQMKPSGKKYQFRKYLEMKALAAKMNIEFTQQLDTSSIEVAQDDDLTKHLKSMKAEERLVTHKWKVGQNEKHNAPVGLAQNPTQPFKSYDNEKYFSYDGQWKDGKLHGIGTYLFRDGKTYEGEWENNRQNGNGKAIYSDDRQYTGNWKNGRYEGRGFFTYTTGAKYMGEFSMGRRGGEGKVIYPCGLVYEGQFHDGKPHGRGIMRSELTGWRYEGSFVRGSISGSGQLVSPSNDREILFFPPTDDANPMLLPDLVRMKLKDKEDARIDMDRQKNSIYGPLRGANLKLYVQSIRANLYNARVKEKKDRYNEAIQKVKEQKAKLYEARMKALAGDA